MTTLSSVRPQRPTPSAAIAAGARASSATSEVAIRQGEATRLGSRAELYRLPALMSIFEAILLGDRPGPHRVPADLLLRPPDPGPVASGLHVPAREPRVQQDLRRRPAHRHPYRGRLLLPPRPLGDGARLPAHASHAAAIEGHDEHLAWVVIVGTIPAVIVGGLGEDAIDENLGEPWMIAMQLIFFGLLLGLADRLPQRRDVDHVSVRHGLYIGLAQALSLAPGTSRSGITITAGRFLGFTRDAAARISFLLLVPATAGRSRSRATARVTDGPAGRGHRTDHRRNHRLGGLGIPRDLRAAALRAHPQLRRLRRLPGHRRRDPARDRGGRARGDVLAAEASLRPAPRRRSGPWSSSPAAEDERAARGRELGRTLHERGSRGASLLPRPRRA